MAAWRNPLFLYNPGYYMVIFPKLTSADSTHRLPGGGGGRGGGLLDSGLFLALEPGLPRRRIGGC